MDVIGNNLNNDAFHELGHDNLLCLGNDSKRLVRVSIEIEPDIATREAHAARPSGMAKAMAREDQRGMRAYWEGSNFRTPEVS